MKITPGEPLPDVDSEAQFSFYFNDMRHF